MRKHEFIDSSKVFSDESESSHAVKAGQYVFLTSMTGRTVKGKWAGVDQIEDQAKQALDNTSLVLEEAGASWDDVVKLLINLSHHRSWERVFRVKHKSYP